MINMLIGSGGGGKSYEAVAFHLLPALISGRMVITNLPVNKELICHIEPLALSLLVLVEPTHDNPRPFSTLSDYGNPWRHPETGEGPLYIIDECHKALPRGGLGRRTADQDVLEWFAEIRHERADALLLTQSIGKVHNDITDNIHLQYRVRKNLAMGSSTTYVRKVIDGARGETMNTTIRKYKPVYFKLYTSHTKSDTEGQEAKAQDVRPIWMHWSAIGAASCFVFFIYALFTGMLNPFPDTAKAAQVEQPKKTVVKRQVPQTKQQSVSALSKEQPLTAEQIAKQKQIEQAELDSKNHPLHRLTLHIAGSITRESDHDSIYAFDAAQNGQPVFTVNDRELLKMGYQLEKISPCMVRIKYGQWQDWITCDSPRQTIRVGAEVSGASGQGGPAVRGVPAPGRT